VAGLELSQELVDWAATTLGWRPSHVHDASWDHAESAVAQLVADDGRCAYLKAHRQARKHRQERAALEARAPSLPATPTLLAAREGSPPALLMSACPGARVGVADLAGVARVPCHHGLGPRNWLWDGTEGLCVIDFEHAQPDVWFADVNRLVDESWHADPGIEDAFWAGYGRRPDAHERRLGDALRVLYAVGTVAWGAEHGDAPFEAQGRAVLRSRSAPGCGP